MTVFTADDIMPPILFSPSYFLTNEISALCELFTRGLTLFHLRKENTDLHSLRNYIAQIPQKYHQHIILHQHTELLQEFPDLGGQHFNRKNPFSLAEMEKYPTKICTQATHSFEEIESLHENIHYAFLSPIYQSISKKDYPAAFSAENIRHFFSTYQKKTPIIALGGVSDKNIKHTLSMGFDNVAILGYLWEDFEKTGNQQKLVEKWEALYS